MKTPQLPRVTQPNTIALTIKISAILLATLAIFHQDLIILTNEAIQSELMTHILAIPFLLIYLLYRKRKILKAVIPLETPNPTRKTKYFNELVGATLCLLAILLYWHGSYTFTPLEYHMTSLPIFVAGCTLLIFNTKTLKTLAFPIAFLLFLTPPPLQIVYQAGAALSNFSSQAAYNILKTSGLPVNLTTQYGIPVIILQKTGGPPLTFAIDIACSGLYSLIGFLIFTVFITYIARTSLWKRATIFLIGFPLIYILNILRITTIVLIGNQYGMQTAMTAFHLLGGWILIFLGTLILLALSEKILKIQIFAPKSKIETCSYCSQNPENPRQFCPACGKLLRHINLKISKPDLAKIAALLICTFMLMSIQVPVFALTKGPAEVIIQTPAGQQKTTEILPEIQGYTQKFIYRDKEFEKIAKQDASLLYTYTPTDNQSEKTIWVTLEIAKSKSSLHPWEVCIRTEQQEIEYQPGATKLDLKDVQIQENPPIIARFFAFQQKDSKRIQAVLYWYENARFQTNTTSQQRYAKISIIAFPENPANIQETEQKLLPFAKAVASYWQPIKTWSQIALILSQNGQTLIAITTTLLIGLLTIQLIRNHTEKKSNLKAYNKLALKEKQILIAVRRTTKEGKKSTTKNIAKTYNKLTQETIQLKTLHQKLEQAEKIGLVKRQISNLEDEPILTWKTQIPL